jgi:ABC-2 type transport system permease protein
MIKLLVIGLKDLKVAFRDKVAWIILAGPFVLTLAMGFVTGAFSVSAGEPAIQANKVVVVNEDEGELGKAMVTWLHDESMRSVVNISVLSSAERARDLVDQGKYVAAMILPADFSQAMLSVENLEQDIPIEMYVFPGQPIRVSIVRSMIERFLARVDAGVVSSQVAVTGLIGAELIQPQEAYTVGYEIGEALVTLEADAMSGITVQSQRVEEEDVHIQPLAILAPSMAMLFLMYTVSGIGGRSILAEREEGTLPRMLATPTDGAWILGGKVLGVMLVGVAQLAIVIGVTSLLFQLHWGDTLGVALMIVAAVFGAAGWGILLAAFARTAEQVSTMGTAMMLFFGLLGGSFFGGESFDGILGTIGKITPNAWAQEGFTILAGAGTLADVRGSIVGLVVMGSILFGVAVVVFRRRGLLRS